MLLIRTAQAAEIPHRSAAPQPPRSPTEYPSDPRRKPGFASAMTKPSYQRSVLSSCCSWTTATATRFPPPRLSTRAVGANVANVTLRIKRFNCPFAVLRFRDGNTYDRPREGAADHGDL